MPTEPTRPRRALDADGQLIAHPYQRSAPGLVSAGSHLQPGPRCTAGDRCEPLDSDGVWTKPGPGDPPVGCSVVRGDTKEKPGSWTRWRAFAYVRGGSNIQLLPYSLVRDEDSYPAHRCRPRPTSHNTRRGQGHSWPAALSRRAARAAEQGKTGRRHGNGFCACWASSPRPHRATGPVSGLGRC
jgi:hypothetical protein